MIVDGVPVSAQVADEQGGGFGFAILARDEKGSVAELGIAVIDGEAKLAHKRSRHVQAAEFACNIEHRRPRRLVPLPDRCHALRPLRRQRAPQIQHRTLPHYVQHLQKLGYLCRRCECVLDTSPPRPLTHSLFADKATRDVNNFRGCTQTRMWGCAGDMWRCVAVCGALFEQTVYRYPRQQ